MTFFMIKTTVLIPNWNGQHWLKGCFEALKDQDFHDFEVILVDDASTDGSVKDVQDRTPKLK